ncbi:hypothetical protein LshimejAT787_0112820 [Lyophyllum shimeji]|uniref:Adenylate kinase n=1 Tax=Lyophyllum shimeji TaxID=47721 RepID=A0A9P3PFC1_LYOSH|nr:hypothetical protein LshimejAT787_0112820 [Lyophyllum shimeji]
MPPPLLGDSEGRYKVRIVGNSGTGKSTTSAALAELLGVPYISLDQLFWEPGWTETPPERFHAKVREAIGQADKGWVVDGDFSSRGVSFVTDECTDLIWLDPPLALYFPRIFIRTMLRLFRLAPPCSPGCPERASEAFFSRESILWWCLSNHWRTRRRFQAWMVEMGVIAEQDTAGRKMRRIGGWGSDLRKWMSEVAEMCRAK